MDINQKRSLEFDSVDKDSPFFICTLFSYVVLKKIVNMTREGLFDEFEYYLGKEYARSLCELHEKKGIKGVSGIKSAFLELQNMGFGITSAVVLNENEVFLKNTTTPIARQYSKSFFDDSSKVDHFISGIYSGILSTAFGKNMEIKEEKCLALGSKECIFANTENIKDRYGIGKMIKEVLLHHSLSSKKTAAYPHFFSKEMMSRGIYTKKDGTIKIANIYHVLFRFGFYILSNHVLSKVEKSSPDLHMFLGYTQALIATDFQKNQFGRKDADSIFNELITHLNMFGYGVPKIELKDEGKMVIHFTESLLLTQSLKFMEVFSDPFLEGAILGFASAFGKPISAIDFEYPKNDEIAVKISFEKGKDLAKELEERIKSHKIKKLVNERMTHKYYLFPS